MARVGEVTETLMGIKPSASTASRAFHSLESEYEQSDEQIEKGHGRLERRQITTTADLNDNLRHEWGGVGQ